MYFVKTSGPFFLQKNSSICLLKLFQAQMVDVLKPKNILENRTLGREGCIAHINEINNDRTLKQVQATYDVTHMSLAKKKYLEFLGWLKTNRFLWK